MWKQPLVVQIYMKSQRQTNAFHLSVCRLHSFVMLGACRHTKCFCVHGPNEVNENSPQAIFHHSKMLDNSGVKLTEAARYHISNRGTRCVGEPDVYLTLCSFNDSKNIT